MHLKCIYDDLRAFCKTLNCCVSLLNLVFFEKQEKMLELKKTEKLFKDGEVFGFFVP